VTCPACEKAIALHPVLCTVHGRMECAPCTYRHERDRNRLTEVATLDR
jgi:hypothetical protein